VYSKLHKESGKQILYQYDKGYGAIDYLDLQGKAIIDAKYKPWYGPNFSRSRAINDIRQLSGYARDVKFLKEPGYDVSEELPVPDCIIIYPDVGGSDDIDTLKLRDCAIEQFYKFYKYGVRLPEKGRVFSEDSLNIWSVHP
jgi:hypothetical protein